MKYVILLLFVFCMSCKNEAKKTNPPEENTEIEKVHIKSDPGAVVQIRNGKTIAYPAVLDSECGNPAVFDGMKFKDTIGIRSGNLFLSVIHGNAILWEGSSSVMQVLTKDTIVIFNLETNRHYGY